MKKTIKDVAEIDSLIKKNSDYIAEFRTQMNIGIQAIKAAAEIYVAALRSHPTTAKKEFADAFPSVSETSWDTLRMIGNHDLNAMAFLLPRVTVKRIASIPIEKQDKIFNSSTKGFKVYDLHRDEEKVVQLADLSPAQVDLVIDQSKGCVRSIEEQRTIMKAAAKQASAIIESQPSYVINGKSVSILKNTVLGARELKNILRTMGEA